MELTARHRDAFWQLVRYGVNGAMVTGLFTAVFVLMDSFTRAPLQLCNLAGYAVALSFGYVLHSRFTFRGHGERGRRSQVRFLLAAFPSYAVNAFWTWLFGTALRWPHWTVQVPIWFVNPFFIFLLNRWWVFR